MCRKFIELPGNWCCIPESMVFLPLTMPLPCRVPEEVAVCGYGNEPSTEVTFPALTTVNKDGYRVGNIAAGLLIRRIEDKEEVPTVTRLLKPELIVRDSTLSVDR